MTRLVVLTRLNLSLMTRRTLSNHPSNNPRPIVSKCETFVSYKATWREIPTDTVDAYYNSKPIGSVGASVRVGAYKPPTLIPLACRAGSASTRLRKVEKPRATAPEAVYEWIRNSISSVFEKYSRAIADSSPELTVCSETVRPIAEMTNGSMLNGYGST